MDRRRQRRTGNRNQRTTTTNTKGRRNVTRRRLANRRNRRVGQGLNLFLLFLFLNAPCALSNLFLLWIGKILR